MRKVLQIVGENRGGGQKYEITKRVMKKKNDNGKQPHISTKMSLSKTTDKTKQEIHILTLMLLETAYGFNCKRN